MSRETLQISFATAPSLAPTTFPSHNADFGLFDTDIFLEEATGKSKAVGPGSLRPPRSPHFRDVQ